MSIAADLGSRFRAELVGRVVAVVAGGLLMVFLARLLDPDEYGLLFLAVSVFLILNLFSTLGIAKSAARYIAEYKENDPAQIPHIIKRSLGFNLITIAIVVVVLSVSYEYIAEILDEPDLTPFLFIGILFIVFEALVEYVRLILQGFEEIELTAAIHAIDRVGRLFFAVGFVLLGFGALGAFGGYIVSFLLASAIGLGIIYSRFYRPLDPAPSMESGLSRRILEYNIPLTATSAAGKLDQQIDVVLVGFFLNPVAVSYYVLSKQIVQFVETPAAALGFSISPTYGKQKAGDQLTTATRVYETTLINTLLLYLPAAVGIIFVASPAIELVFGVEYAGAVPVLQILSLFVVLQAITHITSYALDYLGRARARAIAKGSASIGNVCLNIILIPTIGVVGAAIAIVLTHTMYVGVNLYIVHSELELDWKRIIRKLIPVGLVTAGMTVVVGLLSPFVSGFFSLIAIVAIGVGVWGGLSLLMGLIEYDMIKKSLLSR